MSFSQMSPGNAMKPKDFDDPLEPWEKEDMHRLMAALEQHPFGGSIKGVKPGDPPNAPAPVRLFPDGPIIGWVEPSP